jgi:hypothetical protein
MAVARFGVEEFGAPAAGFDAWAAPAGRPGRPGARGLYLLVNRTMASTCNSRRTWGRPSPASIKPAIHIIYQGAVVPEGGEFYTKEEW